MGWIVLLLMCLHYTHGLTDSQVPDEFLNDLVQSQPPQVIVSLTSDSGLQERLVQKLQNLAISYYILQFIDDSSDYKFNVNKKVPFLFIAEDGSLIELMESLKILRSNDVENPILVLWMSEDRSLIDNELLAAGVFNVFVLLPTAASRISTNNTNSKPFKIHHRNLFKSSVNRNINLWKFISVYEVCAYCDKGNHIIKKLNHWVMGKGFNKALVLVNSFKGSFQNAKLNVGYVKFYPIMDVVKLPDGTSKPVGVIGELLNDVVKSFRYKPEMIRYKSFGILKNGTFNGALGGIQKKEVDIVTTGLMITHERFDKLGFILYGDGNEIKLISIEPEEVFRWQSLFTTFSSTVWICICVSLTIVSICLFLIYRSRNAEASYGRGLFQLVRILFWEDALISSSTKWLPKFVLGVWMLTCFFLVSAFSACLVSFLTKPSQAFKPLDSSQGIKDADMHWYVTQDTGLSKSFGYDEELQQRRRLVRASTGSVGSLKIVLNEPRKASMITADFIAQLHIFNGFTDKYGQHPFHFSKETVQSAYTADWFRKGAVYTPAFQRFYDHYFQAGLTAKLRNDYKVNLKLRGISKARKTGKSYKKLETSVTVYSLTGAFLLYGVCCGLAIVVFACELLADYLYQRI